MCETPSSDNKKISTEKEYLKNEDTYIQSFVKETRNSFSFIECGFENSPESIAISIIVKVVVKRLIKPNNRYGYSANDSDFNALDFAIVYDFLQLCLNDEKKISELLSAINDNLPTGKTVVFDGFDKYNNLTFIFTSDDKKIKKYAILNHPEPIIFSIN